MNSRALSTLAIAGFVLLGTTCVALRYHARSEAELAREDTRWQLTYAAHFETLNDGGRDEARVRLSIPFDSRYCELLNRDNVTSIVPNPNLRSEVRGPTKSARNRMLVLSTRQPGTYDASVSFVVRVSQQPTNGRLPQLESLSPAARVVFLREVPNILPTMADIVREKAQAVTGTGSDADKLARIFAYCIDIDANSIKATDNVVDALAKGRGSAVAKARTMVTLCRAISIPARLVAGFRVAQSHDARPHVWVEVFQDQLWMPFDPTDGWSLNLPAYYIPVRRDSDQIFDRSANVAKLDASFSIRVEDREASLLAAEPRHPLQVLNLTRLPVPMHKVMKILLLLPFAALITTFLRNVIGLQTFGTFSPALLAMSFIYADLKTGLAILVIVITVGLVCRAFLEHLRLLMVPRLSIMLTVAILCVVFGISILHYLMPNISAEVVLLPMIIMTMLIERFHVSAEEDGLMFTLKLAAGTLLVAVLCYLVLRWDEVGSIVLTYPELHFYTIAVFVFLGRYAGYRLTELWRFRDVVPFGEAA